MAAVRFDEFELFAETGELCRNGVRVAVRPQCVELLRILLERPGAMVSRQELIEGIWGATPPNDPELALNTAVGKLREALADSAESPRYIETVPRRGYRFVGMLPGASEGASSRGRLVVAGVGLVVVCAVAWAVIGRPRPAAFQERDVVLVAKFANDTGNAALDGAIEYALEAELANSRYLTVASSERVADVLRLMRQPVVARLEVGKAREVCQRDAAIRAMVTGRLRRNGTSYVVTAEVMEPESGSVMGASTVEAGREEELVGAVKRLAEEVCRRLGEPAGRRAALEKVTVGSLQALKLYSEANWHMMNGRQSVAEGLLKEAIRMEPEFASAHNLLCWSLHNQARPAAEVLPECDLAESLASRVSEREAYFIRATSRELRGETAKADELYETLLTLYPDHYWAAGNLMMRSPASVEKRALRARRVAGFRPNDAVAQTRAAEALSCVAAESDASHRTFKRAFALAMEAGATQQATNIRIRELAFAAMKAFIRGDVDGVVRSRDELENVARTDPGGRGQLSIVNLALGEWRKAREAMEAFPVRVMRDYWLPLVHLARGDLESARANPEAIVGVLPRGYRVHLLLKLGRRDLAIREMELVRRRSSNPPDNIQIADAALALDAGKGDEAIKVLETIRPEPIEIVYGNHYEAWRLLAREYWRMGRRQEAIRVLEKGSIMAPCTGMDAAHFWTQLRYELMRYYQEEGRTAEAARVRADLVHRLKYADREYLIKRALDDNLNINLL